MTDKQHTDEVAAEIIQALYIYRRWKRGELVEKPKEENDG